MKRPIALFILLTILGAGSPLSAQGSDEEKNLQELYLQIDEAIDQFPQYVAKRLSQIADTRKMLGSDNNMEKRFALAERLFELYVPYKNDSALYFADLCISLADSLHKKDKEGLYLSLKAHQCSNAGMYVEALNLLKRVDRHALDREGLMKYYTAWMHVCGEIGSSSQQNSDRWSYYDLQDSYRDSVLSVASEGSEEFLHLKMDVLSARKLYQDALDVSDSWLSKVADGTHENAYAAFYRSVVYDKLGNKHLSRYWLGRSALDDIKCAVNDQASLLFLAERLCDDGDYDRAYRYVRFSEECNTTFSPQLRNYQMRCVAQVMGALYQNSQDRYSRLLTIACIGALLLLGVIVLLLIRKRRRSMLMVLALMTVGLAQAQTKSVSVLGDSYSTYENFMTPNTNELWYYAQNAPQKTDVANVRQTWWHQVISENGWRLCVNNSYSGATISYSGYDGNDYSARSFNTRMDNLGQPDIIFIFGATNDSWAGAPVGEYKYEGITLADLYTFRPALARMLQWMTDRYINTEIYFILNNELREEINSSVKTICAHYGVPVIELKDIDKLSGHPSVKGMRQIADQVNSFLKARAQ